MIMRTHLAIGLAVGLFLLPNVDSKWIFLPVVLAASLLPDIDSGFSRLGRKGIFRILQWFVKHRGVIHSLTFAFVISIVFAFFAPVLALPFFLGYSFHLLVDGFTPEGVRPFWPFKSDVKGRFKTGGRIEDMIFVVFLLIDVLLLIGLFV